MDFKSLDRSLMESLGDSQAIDLAADTAEYALDALLDDGIIKDIPILGHALKLWRGGLQIQSYLFARKLLLFLSSLKQVPEDIREKFLLGIENDPQHKQKVGEHLLLLLDRMDDLEKPNILSKIFCSYIKGEIDFTTFREISHAIDLCSPIDLFSLITNISFNPNMYDEGIGDWVYGDRDIDTATASRLAASGILFKDNVGITVTRIGLTITKILNPEVIKKYR